MRPRLLAVLALAGASACATGDRPYRFSSPMLGTATVPPAPLPGAPAAAAPELANHEVGSARTARAIRVVSAPPIREASAAAADRITHAPAARPVTRAQLAAPHRVPASAPLPGVHPLGDPRSLEELRALVGRRDPRDPIAVALAWTRELGLGIGASDMTGAELVAWAQPAGRLATPAQGAAPGDLLVFDHARSDDAADLVALVLGRDERGVVEYLYVGGGVVRRGFVDPARPRTKRDGDDRIVNTFLRHGRRWPARGTRYLAGELLAHVIRAR